MLLKLLLLNVLFICELRISAANTEESQLITNTTEESVVTDITEVAETNIEEKNYSVEELLHNKNYSKEINDLKKFLDGVNKRLETLETENKGHGFQFSNLNATQVNFSNSLTEEVGKLETKIQDLNNRITKQIDESKREIFSSIHEKIRNWELSQVFTSTWPNITSKHQDGGCGGVLIGDKGSISYYHQSSENKTGEFRCIWTVRANLYEKVAFKLISGNVDASNNTTLVLSPLATLNKENVTFAELRDDTRKILGSHLYILDGPVVFVTLISNYSSVSPNFILFYEGRGNETSALIQYRHYHYTEAEGEVDYPRMRDENEYSPYETVTFAINPQHVKLNIHLHYIDLENSTNCQYDALTFFQPVSTFYARTSKNNFSKNYRYCLENKKLDHDVNDRAYIAYIVTFKSDAGAQYTGFRFSWPYLN